MDDFAIRINGVGKRLRLGSQGSYDLLSGRFQSGFARALKRSADWLRGRRSEAGPITDSPLDFWALRDITLDVPRGQVLGIIGRNGGGKSTLLKILSRIMYPTEGRVEIRGRVGSLLEVGTGFHPDLTGRENIFLNGAVLGMGRAEIARRFDEIVSFAEVEKFIDTPVKRYSSGMYTRLAFSVAAMLEPDVLLVDEVLAVGDAAFQKRSMGKMESVAREGRTILFVSHNLIAMQSLCNRAIWLDQGRIVLEGSPTEVSSRYLEVSNGLVTEQLWEESAAAPGTDKVRLRRAAIHPVGGETSDLTTVHTPIELEFEFWNQVPETKLHLSIVVFNEEGAVLFCSTPFHEPIWFGRPMPQGLYRSVCAIPGDLLNSGSHRVTLHVIENGTQEIYRHDGILNFEIHDDISLREHWFGKWGGAFRPNLEWRTARVESAEIAAAEPSRVAQCP